MTVFSISIPFARLARVAALAIALLLVGPPGRGQSGEPQVTAQLNTGLAKFGSTVQCRVSVEGARRADLKEIPKIDGLRLEGTGGPNVSEQMSFRGGRRNYSRTISWVIVLRPERLGEFTIPPLRLEVDGEEAFTRELTLSVVEDLRGKELGTLSVVDPPARVFEGEPFTIRMRFGWDVGLGRDVNYLNLILPWWGELPGTLEIDDGATKRGADRLPVRLNNRDQVTVRHVGQEELRDRQFHVLELERTFVATRPGTLTFPVSYFEFGQIVESFFETRKDTYHVGYDAFEVEVEALPEDGRPFDFSGAVGRLGADAAADRRDVDAGDSIKLKVEWSGRANLEFFEPPDLGRLERFTDFRSYGRTDRFYGNRRVVEYDLAPIAPEVQEIPAVPLVVFDPELGTYRTIETAPIPIRVRALEGGSGLEFEPGAGGPVLDIHDIQTGRPDSDGDGPRGPGAGVVGGAMLAIPILWLGLRIAVRRRGDPAAPAARRRRAARRRLARELRRAPRASAQEAALHRFLAARSGEPAEAWEGRDPLEGWERLGIGSEEDARALSGVQRELEARHWAGDDKSLEASRVLEVADRLIRGGL